MKKQKAIIFDLDDTLCQTDHRRHFVEGDYKEKDFVKFYENMHLDPPHEWCVRLLRLYHSIDYKIIFCSGRPEEYREKTQEWILEHVLLIRDQYSLFMRETGNYEKDTTLKKRLYQEYIEPHFDVELIVDDRSSVVQLWRSLGLTCLQCAPNDF